MSLVSKLCRFQQGGIALNPSRIGHVADFTSYFTFQQSLLTIHFYRALLRHKDITLQLLGCATAWYWRKRREGLWLRIYSYHTIS